MRRLAVMCAVLALAGCGKHEVKEPPEVTPPPPAPKAWRLMSKQPDAWLLISSKIDTAKEFKRVWYAVVYAEPKDGVATSNSLSEIDCANRASRELQELGYDAKSQPLKFEVREKPQWSYAPPETVAYDVLGAACEGKAIKDKGGFDRLEEARSALLASKQAPKK